MVRYTEDRKSQKPEFVWDVERKNRYNTFYNNYCIIQPNEAGNKSCNEEKENYTWLRWMIMIFQKKTKKN